MLAWSIGTERHKSFAEKVIEYIYTCVYTILSSWGSDSQELHYFSSPLFKVVLLGEGCVGKTSLVLRYCQNTFNDKHLTTLQVRIKEGGCASFFFSKKTSLPLPLFFLSASCACARSPSLSHGVPVAPSLCLSASLPLCLFVRPPACRPSFCVLAAVVSFTSSIL